MTGSVDETYAAALQHDLVDLEGATPVGVVRRPPPWFHAAVAENHRELGPPEDLLEAARERREDLKTAGTCETGAHNAAFEEVDFDARYREHLQADDDAGAALAALWERVSDGEDISLVCFEADDRRCHRHALREVLLDSV